MAAVAVVGEATMTGEAAAVVATIRTEAVAETATERTRAGTAAIGHTEELSVAPERRRA